MPGCSCAQIPLELAVCRGSCDAGIPPERIVSIPSYNASPIYRFPVRRSGFVTRTTTITFAPKSDKEPNTILQTITVNKPSEALAVAQTPGAVIGSFFEV